MSGYLNPKSKMKREREREKRGGGGNTSRENPTTEKDRERERERCLDWTLEVDAGAERSQNESLIHHAQGQKTGANVL